MILKVYKVWAVLDSLNDLGYPNFLKCFIIERKIRYSYNNPIL